MESFLEIIFFSLMILGNLMNFFYLQKIYNIEKLIETTTLDTHKIFAILSAIDADVDELIKSAKELKAKTDIPPMKTNNWENIKKAFHGPKRKEIDVGN